MGKQEDLEGQAPRRARRQDKAASWIAALDN
jgi:hypothetical protein